MRLTSPGLFRLILAIVVFVGHVFPLYINSIGVYLFFMLSGYWIYVMWTTKYLETLKPYKTFLITRIWRLFPSFWVAVALLFIANRIFDVFDLHWGHQAIITKIHFIFSHLFILGYGQLSDNLRILAPVWSLDAELQFYIVAPLIILAANKLPKLKWPFIAIGGFSVVGLLLFSLGMSPTWTCGELPFYLGFFVIGLSVARFNIRPPGNLVAGLSIFVFAFYAIVLLMPSSRGLVYGHEFHGYQTPIFAMPIQIISALMLAPLAMYTVRQKSSRIDRHIGNISYEFYLIHWIAADMLHLWFFNSSELDLIVYFVISIFFVLSASVLVYIGIDRPFDRYRRVYIKNRTIHAV